MKIKHLEIGFENCEVIKIGVKDIKMFKNTNEEILLETVDNGDSEYISTWSENKISPLQRLTDYNDITSIEVHYEEGNEAETITPEWYYENEWCCPENNAYQINEVIDYKNRKVVISKQQYIANRREELNNIIKDAQEELDMLPCKILVSDMVNL